MSAARNVTFAALALGAATMGCLRPVCGPPGARAMSSSHSVTAVAIEDTPSEDEVAAADAHPHCRHQVPLVSARDGSMRAHDILLRVSATCAPVAPQQCDETLRARACAAGADAVVLDDRGGAPDLERTSASDGDQRVVSAALVRWTQ